MSYIFFYYCGPGQIFPSYVYGKSHEQSVHFILDYTLNFVPICVSTSFVLCNVALISFILKVTLSEGVSFELISFIRMSFPTLVFASI